MRFSNEEDFIKALSRESCDVDGIGYRPFQWTIDFKENSELALVLVWITLPGLLPNFYHEAFLKNISAPIGVFLHRDNATCCTT